jgi:tetratricopeptide (TPR) repeat protein
MAIGQVYWRKKEFDLALINEQNALEILLPLNHRQLSVVYGIMANIYRDKNELHSAIQCSEKALTVDRQYLPSNHSNFGTTYTNMGLTYDKMGDYKQALVCYAKARDVFLKSLPPTHPDILVLEQNIRDAEAEINHD